ncbi:MAG: VanZ family protein [Candidatus Bipolaricaulia bacterium]
MGHSFWKAALVLYAAFIFWLSSRPLPEGLPLLPQWDKLWHFLEYLLFGLLAWQAFLPQSRSGWTWAILLSLGYAGSDELHQLFVPMRTASLLDWLVDSLGIGSGLLLGRFGGLHFLARRV